METAWAEELRRKLNEAADRYRKIESFVLAFIAAYSELVGCLKEAVKGTPVGVLESAAGINYHGTDGKLKSAQVRTVILQFMQCTLQVNPQVVEHAGKTVCSVGFGAGRALPAIPGNRLYFAEIGGQPKWVLASEEYPAHELPKDLHVFDVAGLAQAIQQALLPE